MKELTKKNYNDIKTLNKCVVKVEASWCGPCRMITPVVNEVSESYPSVPFYKADVDVVDAIKEYEVNALPTLLFLRNGEVAHRIVGMTTIGAIKHATKVLDETTV